jgi:dephospho-CoA kinase
MIVVGITGSLASGKTQVTKLFKKHGAETFDADAAARKAVKKGSPVYRAIVKLFGKAYVKADGSLNRQKLAARVFASPRDLRKLNILIHPAVILDGVDAVDRVKKKEGILALDVPLLFESKMDNLADFTVVVRSRRETVFARAAERGMSHDLARKILATQWSPEKKAKLADFVIVNNGNVRDLDKKVLALIRQIKLRAVPTGRQAAARR